MILVTANDGGKYKVVCDSHGEVTANGQTTAQYGLERAITHFKDCHIDVPDDSPEDIFIEDIYLVEKQAGRGTIWHAYRPKQVWQWEPCGQSHSERARLVKNLREAR